MVHVSELAPYRISKPSDFIDVGTEVTVKVKKIDDQKRVNLTMVGLEENNPLWIEKKGEEKRNDGGFSGGNGFREKRNNFFNKKPQGRKKF